MPKAPFRDGPLDGRTLSVKRFTPHQIYTYQRNPDSPRYQWRYELERTDKVYILEPGSGPKEEIAVVAAELGTVSRLEASA